jgi:hypothetical protein
VSQLMPSAEVGVGTQTKTRSHVLIACLEWTSLLSGYRIRCGE